MSWKHLEHKRKNTLIAVVLIMLLASASAIAVYAFAQAQQAEEAAAEKARQNLILNSMLYQVQQTAQKTSFNLTFISSPTKEMVNNMVSFIFGYIDVTDLKDLYYPATLAIAFNVTYTTTGTATVQYSYSPPQYINLPRGIPIVQIPFGIFPLAVTNAAKNEIITFNIFINATVTWDPVNVEVANALTTGIMQVKVTSGETPSVTPTSPITPTPTAPTVTPTSTITPTAPFVTPTPTNQNGTRVRP